MDDEEDDENENEDDCRYVISPGQGQGGQITLFLHEMHVCTYNSL